MESDIRKLLRLVDDINRPYEEDRIFAERTGKQYNIFEVLGLTSSEVTLHSTFIVSLLLPGRHGAGTKFLEAFLRMQRLDLPADYFNISKVKVEREKYIGRKTEKEGGRIDLILSDGHHSLIIENKIYADDQKNQLLRYHNYRPDAKLVYLSLFEDGKPSKKSLGTLNLSDVTCISYKFDVLHWLEECVQIASDLPQIRETINQYIKTIKRLTNSSMATHPEIISLISQKENLTAAFAVRDNLDAALNEIMKTFADQLKDRVSQQGGPFTCITENTNDDKDFMGKPRFLFKHSNWKSVAFAMEFEHARLQNFAIGFIRLRDVKEDIRQLPDVKELAKKLNYDSKSTSSWFWSYPSDSYHRNWCNATSMEMLRDGRMADWIIDMLTDVAASAEGLSL